MTEWQPIETAPKDETILLYLSSGGIADGFWEAPQPDGPDIMGHDAGWHNNEGTMFPGRSFGNPDYYSDGYNQPTHWMPLPEPPKETT